MSERVWLGNRETRTRTGPGCGQIEIEGAGSAAELELPEPERREYASNANAQLNAQNNTRAVRPVGVPAFLSGKNHRARIRNDDHVALHVLTQEESPVPAEAVRPRNVKSFGSREG